MGLFSLAGSFFGGIGSAVGGVLDSLIGGGGDEKKSSTAQRPQFVGLSPSTMPNAMDVEQRPYDPDIPIDYNELARQVAEQKYRDDPTLQFMSDEDGKGGGGSVKGTLPTTRHSNVNQNTSAAGGSAAPSLNLDDILNKYLGQTMTYGGLPDSAWDSARGNLVGSLNAQAQNSRSQVLNNMSRRGLANSGVQARALQGVEAAKGQAIASGLASIAQNQATNQSEERRWAVQTALDATLRRQQLELNARQLGINEQQIKDAKNSSFWNTIGGIAGLAGELGWFGGSSNNSATGDATAQYWERVGIGPDSPYYDPTYTYNPGDEYKM